MWFIVDLRSQHTGTAYSGSCSATFRDLFSEYTIILMSHTLTSLCATNELEARVSIKYFPSNLSLSYNVVRFDADKNKSLGKIILGFPSRVLFG